MTRLQPLSLACAATATALVLRLAGVGISWLPDAGPLALALAALSLLPRALASHSRQAWSAQLRTHGFAIGLGLIVCLALLVRLPGLTSDIGHAPIDIDENRLAANVAHFFATGELRHDTVEHYPGAVFWLFAFASLLGYLASLTGRFVVGPTELPVELFVRSARLANVAVGGGIVLFTGLLGRRLGGDRVGLTAAALVAIVPLSVDTTVLVRNDPGMVLAVLAAVYYAVVAVEDQRDRWVMASGALAGVATAIKYSSVFALVPALIAAGAGPSMPARIRRGLRAAGSLCSGRGADKPLRLGRLPEFPEAVGGPGGDYRTWTLGCDRQPRGLLRLGAGSLRVGMAAALAGRRDSPSSRLCTGRAKDFAFLSFPLLYLWFMTKRPSQFPRWVFPLVPFVTVAGVAARLGAAAVGRAGDGRWSPGRDQARRACGNRDGGRDHLATGQCQCDRLQPAPARLRRTHESSTGSAIMLPLGGWW